MTDESCVTEITQALAEIMHVFVDINDELCFRLYCNG